MIMFVIATRERNVPQHLVDTVELDTVNGGWIIGRCENGHQISIPLWNVSGVYSVERV